MTETSRQGKLVYPTMAVAIANNLRDRILRFDIPQGSQLRQDSLASEFGASRIPVREALLQLEGEGLVEQQAHKGYKVTKLSVKEMEELFDLREIIETDLLARAIPRMTDEDIGNAREVERQFDETLSKGTEVATWGSLNWELHSTLYWPAQRDRTMRFLHNLHRSTDRYLRIQLNMNEMHIQRAQNEHRQLVDLCASGDTDAACQLLSQHLVGARDDLMRLLDNTDVIPSS